MTEQLFSLPDTPDIIIEGGFEWRRVECKSCKGTRRISAIEVCLACRDGKVWVKGRRA